VHQLWCFEAGGFTLQRSRGGYRFYPSQQNYKLNGKEKVRNDDLHRVPQNVHREVRARGSILLPRVLEEPRARARTGLHAVDSKLETSTTGLQA